MMPKPKKPPRDLESEDAVDLESLMAMPMGDEGSDDEYADDELAEAGASEGVGLDPELMSEFEAFDDPSADTSTRASALENFVRLCKQKAY